MATLKVRYAEGRTRWYPTVRRVTVIKRWDVFHPADSTNPPSPYDPTWDGTDSSEGRGTHTPPGVEHDWFDDSQPHAVLLNLLVEPSSDWASGEVDVVVPAGDAWLMGDQGQTIDRIT